ncbi:hypothetical protein THRCLA_21315 [Thraustotheca clavata]|uniref:Uncharacterized protein n=1 Tax=Thraustotheca clavata TaxID=74557 RepID=A0A1V9ZXR6_9STRA|nr:hypothetical protein THRCLA_21315 [Thraustotheca clavata]
MACTLTSDQFAKLENTPSCAFFNDRKTLFNQANLKCTVNNVILSTLSFGSSITAFSKNWCKLIAATKAPPTTKPSFSLSMTPSIVILLASLVLQLVAYL